MHIWALGLSCETPAASGPPGLLTTARELQTCTFQGPGASNTTKIPRKDPKREKEERKLWREEGKKSAKFWAPHPSGLHASGGNYPSGPPPFGGPTLGGPKIQHLKIGRSRNWPKSKMAEVENGRSRYWPKSNWPNSKKTAGRSRNWPKSITPDPSPRHLWMPPRRLFHTSLSLKTFLRNSHSRSFLSDVSTRVINRGSWLHRLRAMFSAPRVPDPSLRYFLTRLCRRLCTASHLTMPPHNYHSRSSSSGVSSPMTLKTAKPRHRHIATLATPHFQNPLTLLRFTVPAAPTTPATVTSALRPHVCYHSRHRVSRSMPVSAPVMVYLLSGPGATSSVYIHLSHAPTATCQYHPSGYTPGALSFYVMEKCKYRPSGNPQSCWCRSSSRKWSFS